VTGGSEPGSANAIPPFAALRAFEAAGRLGGIRKAAAALSLHHAVVSRHIASLERWLGHQLVVRGGTGKFLTEVGERYHARIRSAFLELADATSEVTHPARQTRLRIWTNGGFASKWLAARIADFTSRYALEIELRPSDSPPDLLNHEAEVDIRYHGDDYSPAPGGRGLRWKEFARPHILAVAAPSVARAVEPLASLTDLLKLPLLHEESDAQWRAWLVARGHPVPDELPGARLWHAHLAIAAAAEGRGVALASHYLVADELRRGLLVELSPPERRGESIPLGGYVFATRGDRWDSSPLRQFREWITQAAAADC
jgi:DNA-binding transcriptional LysR family regulator